MAPCLEIIVLTLFPEMFTGVLNESILKRAIADGQLSVRLVNFRDFANDKHKTVDDYPFGGGAGMLLKPAPLFEAIRHIQSESSGPAGRVVLMTPRGSPLHRNWRRTSHRNRGLSWCVDIMRGLTSGCGKNW